MSWLTGGTPTRDDLLDLRPDLARDHRATLDEVWSGVVDPSVLELCRLRTATLLDSEPALRERTPAATDAGLDEDKIGALAQWPTDPRFTTTERACIALAEQYVIDVHGVTDADVDRVQRAIGPDGVVTLTTALALWELTNRFDNALGASTAATNSEKEL